MFRLLITFLFSSLSLVCFGQPLFSPQINYDSQGGFYERDSIRTINIEFYDDNYMDILHNGWEMQSGLRLPAKLSLSNGITYDSVSVRYKGNATYSIAADQGSPKRPFNIDLNDIVNEQLLMGYNKVKLANCFLDPSYSKEVLAYGIYQKYLPSPEANFINLKVQNENYGLYSNTESINKQFLRKHFGESDGVLIKCDPLVQFGQQGEGISDLAYLGPDSSDYFIHYTMKSETGWSDLLHLIDILNNKPEELSSILNIDRVLWAFAANMALANLDSYNGFFRHNYYLYQTNDGLFQMIPWDVSESFVGAFLGFNQNDPDFFYNYDPFFGFFSWYEPLVSELIVDKSSLTSKIFAAHLRTILEESLVEDEIDQHLSEVWELISVHAEKDTLRPFELDWVEQNLYHTVSNDDFITAGILSTVKKRNDFLNNHGDINLQSPEFLNIDLRIVNGQTIIDAQVSNTDFIELMATTNQNASFFESFPMYDDGTNGDEIANDHVFSAIIPFQEDEKEVKYYLRAHNNEAIKLSPQRAEYEFYYLPVTDRLDDLVINEFMASNDSTVQDQNGEYDDWIEFFNNSNQEINLNNYGLSDEIGGDLWFFPDTIISPKSYLIVWADKDEEQNGLHANFKLSASGESVVLVNNDGIEIDHIAFEEQETDLSYGRFPNGTGEFTSMPATFSEENSLVTAISYYSKQNSVIKVKPNPVGSFCSISLETKSSASNLHMMIYSQDGKLIKSFDHGTYSDETIYFNWNLTDKHGNRVPSGIYHGFIFEKNKQYAFKVIVI